MSPSFYVIKLDRNCSNGDKGPDALLSIFVAVSIADPVSAEGQFFFPTEKK